MSGCAPAGSPPRFPLFVSLVGARCLVVGAGAVDNGGLLIGKIDGIQRLHIGRAVYVLRAKTFGFYQIGHLAHQSGFASARPPFDDKQPAQPVRVGQLVKAREKAQR